MFPFGFHCTGMPIKVSYYSLIVLLTTIITLLLLLLAGTNCSEFSDDITIAKNSTRQIVLHGLEISRKR